MVLGEGAKGIALLGCKEWEEAEEEFFRGVKIEGVMH